jgi:hypothetical protein
MRIGLAVGLGICGLALWGCGSTDKRSPTTSASTAVTHPAPAHSRQPRTHGRPPLSGFGATVAAWNDRHRMDPRFALNSAYDPDPTLARGGDERFDDRYFGVTPIDGRMLRYEMRFPPGTSVDAAKQRVLRSEFPTDAKVVGFRRRSTCAVMNVRSPTLARVLHDGATASVEFGSGENDDSYDPADVWTALVTFPPVTEC